MITIKLTDTVSVRKTGVLKQDWDVNGVEYTTISEWGDIDFQDEDNVLCSDPKVTAHQVIVLAIHGNGPVVDGDSYEWGLNELVETLETGGYLEHQDEE